jgi:hypothetical protein
VLLTVRCFSPFPERFIDFICFDCQTPFYGNEVSDLSKRRPDTPAAGAMMAPGAAPALWVTVALGTLAAAGGNFAFPNFLAPDGLSLQVTPHTPSTT